MAVQFIHYDTEVIIVRERVSCICKCFLPEVLGTRPDPVDRLVPESPRCPLPPEVRVDLVYPEHNTVDECRCCRYNNVSFKT